MVGHWVAGAGSASCTYAHHFALGSLESRAIREAWRRGNPEVAKLSRLRMGVARRSEGAWSARKATTAISKHQDPASCNFTQDRLKEQAY